MPDNSPPVKVHVTPWMVLPLLVVGLLCLGLGLWVALLERTPNLQIVLGAVISLNGVLNLKTPVFALETDNIALYRPIGLVRRRFPFESRSEIRVDGNRLFVGEARVPVQKWCLNRSEWRVFEESIAR